MNPTVYDVVVVGAGNAALCAALTAKQHGANVLMIERAPLELRGGNSAFSGAGMRFVYSGVEDIKSVVRDLTEEELATSDFGSYSAEEYLDALATTSQYRTDPDLAEVLVRRSTETVQWLREFVGARFIAKYGDASLKHEGRWKFFGGSVVRVNGAGAGLVEAEFKAVEKHGIPVRYATRAIQLLQGNTGIEGVRVIKNRETEDIRARAVVLACGGFEANREWRTRYLGAGWDLAKVRGTRYNTGDGISMALDSGAQPCGNWSGAHASQWDLNAPDFGDIRIGDAFSKHSYPLCIMINNDGMRFLDEGEETYNYTYAKYGRVVLQQPAQTAWQIFDGKTIKQLRGSYRIKQVTKVSANTLEGLVGKLEGMNAKQALATIQQYNAAIKKDVPFNPNIKDGRCTVGLPVPKSNWAQTIDTPPFEAYGVTCGITFTFGGVKISTSAEVVDIENQPIPGLYAAGEMVGGIFYFNYPSGSGLVSGAVFGRTAGENAASYARSTK